MKYYPHITAVALGMMVLASPASAQGIQDTLSELMTIYQQMCSAGHEDGCNGIQQTHQLAGQMIEIEDACGQGVRQACSIITQSQAKIQHGLDRYWASQRDSGQYGGINRDRGSSRGYGGGPGDYRGEDYDRPSLQPRYGQPGRGPGRTKEYFPGNPLGPYKDTVEDTKDYIRSKCSDPAHGGSASRL